MVKSTDELKYQNPRCLTARDVEIAFVHSRPHPVSCDIPLLERFEPDFPCPENLDDDGFRACAPHLTDDDPQRITYVLAARQRNCFDVPLRPGTQLVKLFAYMADPLKASAEAVKAWNDLAREYRCLRTEDYPIRDFTPFIGQLSRLKMVTG